MFSYGGFVRIKISGQDSISFQHAVCYVCVVRVRVISFSLSLFFFFIVHLRSWSFRCIFFFFWLNHTHARLTRLICYNKNKKRPEQTEMKKQDAQAASADSSSGGDEFDTPGLFLCVCVIIYVTGINEKKSLQLNSHVSLFVCVRSFIFLFFFFFFFLPINMEQCENLKKLLPGAHTTTQKKKMGQSLSVRFFLFL